MQSKGYTLSFAGHAWIPFKMADLDISHPQCVQTESTENDQNSFIYIYSSFLKKSVTSLRQEEKGIYSYCTTASLVDKKKKG